MKQISSKDFDSEVLRSNEPVLVDFFTELCGPCRMLAPMLEEIATESQGQLKVVKVDAAAESALAGSFGVQAVPALFVFKNGNVVGQTVGLKSKAKFEEVVRGSSSYRRLENFPVRWCGGICLRNKQNANNKKLWQLT